MNPQTPSPEPSLHPPTVPLLELYRRMCLSRHMDETLPRLVAEGLVRGPMHLGVGQEAVGIGATAALQRGDIVTGTHRPHSLYVGLGLPLGRTFAEMMGRADGQCRGRGGHMLVGDREHGLLGPSGIVGHSLLLAVGHGTAQRRAGDARVTLCMTGDGSVNSGAFNEALNMMALWRLPVVVLVENNGYGLSVRLDRHVRETELHRRAAGFGMPGRQVDGGDPEAVRDAVAEAAERARAGDGPTLVEAVTFRDSAFSGSDRGGYRPDEEWEGYVDPLERAAARLRERGVPAEALAGAAADAARRIADAVDFARASPWPDPEELLAYAAAWDEGGAR
ncbi:MULTISPECIES: thiamine pyrophosphate-dependent dehydrogenase E1 component subunit alpha [unclassified Streptomyces]|uniref:thiamine pyrophosphate-dependent dehydrogenase E1 component subunit alpha n=1 Tax=unclassified Streptomyces TaxID=2593676 RepID=UPI0022B62374|nr:MULTISPECIES: thiamine pyrophosphate-dependent dehydrogenase E1 component subunit alpha [unclassified Streptomyces]MCZ7416441.1 thiamine pyrophosphate-dependent dehydrogenase E1 component subunit alpha [Streptomyces sp. WMMC897]MCZ7433748.1 thiamine pyrophosphate-dependent dehydrogenase E1 component subunit alpha [Streptomyces sp. WMMC1477]